MSRGKYAPEFKTKLVLEVLRGERELGTIAAEHNLNPQHAPQLESRISGACVQRVRRSGQGRAGSQEKGVRCQEGAGQDAENHRSADHRT